MVYEVDRYQQAFDDAKLGLEVANYQGGLPLASDATAYDFLVSGRETGLGLAEVIITRETLANVVGRPLLMLNRQTGEFSPAVVSLPDAALSHVAQITLFAGETFLPHKGLTAGQHIGITAKVEASSPQFGGHGGSVSLEPGHFGSLMLGASNKAIGARIEIGGDAATDAILKNATGGLVEQMSAGGLVDLGRPITKLVDFSQPGVQVQAFWHKDTMQSAEGTPLRADYPSSIQRLLGAGVLALGPAGLNAARELLPHITRGGN